MWQNETEKDGEELFPPRPLLRETLRYKRQPRRDAESPLLMVQLLLCALLLGAVLLARALLPGIYGELQRVYREVLAAPRVSLDREELESWWEQGGEALRSAAARLLQEAQPEQKPAGLQTAGIGEPALSRARKAPEGCSLCTLLPEGWQPPLEEWTVSSPYGWRRDPFGRRKWSFHRGIDLAVGEGTPVLAPADGWAELVCRSDSAGNWVQLRHGDGCVTRYCHLQYAFVHPGEKVKQGECLGTAGRTGRATGAHLHWELLREGIRYDPSAVLGQAASGAEADGPAPAGHAAGPVLYSAARQPGAGPAESCRGTLA